MSQKAMYDKIPEIPYKELAGALFWLYVGADDPRTVSIFQYSSQQRQFVDIAQVLSAPEVVTNQAKLDSTLEQIAQEANIDVRLLRMMLVDIANLRDKLNLKGFVFYTEELKTIAQLDVMRVVPHKKDAPYIAGSVLYSVDERKNYVVSDDVTVLSPSEDASVPEGEPQTTLLYLERDDGTRRIYFNVYKPKLVGTNPLHGQTPYLAFVEDKDKRQKVFEEIFQCLLVNCDPANWHEGLMPGVDIRVIEDNADTDLLFPVATLGFWMLYKHVVTARYNDVSVDVSEYSGTTRRMGGATATFDIANTPSFIAQVIVDGYALFKNTRSDEAIQELDRALRRIMPVRYLLKDKIHQKEGDRLSVLDDIINERWVDGMGS